MKFERNKFSAEFYQLWEEGLPILSPDSASIYSVKYRNIENCEYALVQVKAEAVTDALERACYVVADSLSLRPEDVELHSVYDIKGNLLWGEELAHALARSKYESQGMERREFLAAFGLASAALLFGIRPRLADAATTSVNITGTASGFTYVDDVFSTYLYTGNNAVQTINNGIDLAGNGGMVWVKDRSNAQNNVVWTRTVGGQLGFGDQYLSPNLTSALTSSGFSMLSNGFQLTAGFAYSNASGDQYASWAFRKAPNFFDCGTFVAGSDANRRIPHSLGVAPGMIIVKHTTTTSGWYTYHRSTGRTGLTNINLGTAVDTTQSWWGASDPTSNDFGVNEPQLFSSGQTVVWYAWAHDTSANGVVQCGSFSAVGTGSQLIPLGFEPQWFLAKNVDATEDWFIWDIERGLSFGGTKRLSANSTASESANAGTANKLYPTPTGLEYNQFFSGPNKYIYVAIRRPNKPPTTGTQVYMPVILNNGTDGAGSNTNVGFSADMLIARDRAGALTPILSSRLTGGKAGLYTNATAAEVADVGFIELLTNTGFTWLAGDVASSSSYPNKIFHFFRRAAGFFDIVCYTGDGSSNRPIGHNLMVPPNLIIIKSRSAATDWKVKVIPSGSTIGPAWWFSALTTASASLAGNDSTNALTVNVGEGLDFFNVNVSGQTYIAYMFASLPGISKIGSYSGNGTSQTINCGFSTGARFILVKRTDQTGAWYIWDSARGIAADTDPHFNFNQAAAEATDDSVDPDNLGFIVNQVPATNINVSGGTYIFLAIS